jgi:hypothetical protein
MRRPDIKIGRHIVSGMECRRLNIGTPVTAQFFHVAGQKLDKIERPVFPAARLKVMLDELRSNQPGL